MFTKLKKSHGESEKGFTIIEVMIVLAIAGLILLIVFLAIPALQRNSRNTQRKNDAAALAGSINEFVNNNNGTPPTAAQAAGTGAAVSGAHLGYYTNTAHLYSATTGTPPTAAGTGNPTATNVTTESVTVWVGYTCNNNLVTAANSTRSVAIQYAVETSGAPLIQCTQS